MVFSSLTFLYFFLPIVFILYFVCRNRTWRNGVLLISSLLFYSWGEPSFVFTMVLSSLLAWVCGLGIEKYRENEVIKRVFFLASLIALLGILFVFKYLNFFFDSIGSITGILFNVPEIMLPIGISFYTFQILSYVIDLYRQQVSVQKSFFRFLLYVCFFPQLIAGPIVRYKTVEEEISQRSENWDDAIYGMRRFIIGLAKKVLIANNIALISDTIYANPAISGTLAFWVASLCFGLQIYYDFSGYSDMAIGLGRIFGFHFLENFDYPYAALSITDHWRRWHISMSSWFRDYVYIPLGGSKVAKPRWVLNVLIVWSLTGLWHGASWNYLFWGIYYCILLVLEKFFLYRLVEKLPNLLRHVYTVFLVCIGMTIFWGTDTEQLMNVLKNMFSFVKTDWISLLLVDVSIFSKLIAFPAALVFAFPVFAKVNLNENRFFVSLLVNGTYLGLLAVSIMYIISSSYNPFIYFRF